MSEPVDIDIQRLIEEAMRALQNSYAPYSGIHVASSILTDTGRIYTGVNIENASYGLTICAERSAISAMITGGDRKPLVVTVVTDLDEPIPPCGACRQVIAEFNPRALIIMYSIKSRKLVKLRLDELFPYPFRL